MGEKLTQIVFFEKNAHLKSCHRQRMLLDLKANIFFLMWVDELCKLWSRTHIKWICSSKNEHKVIIFSPLCILNPVRLSFFHGSQKLKRFHRSFSMYLQWIRVSFKGCLIKSISHFYSAFKKPMSKGVNVKSE